MATHAQGTFSCSELTPKQEKVMMTPKVSNPATYGLVRSDAEWREVRNTLVPPGGMPRDIGEIVRVTRKVINSGKLTMHDGTELVHWGFEDDAGIRDFPSTPIVLSGGDLLQATLESSMRQHTIHWHGIEPDPLNDGVGHTSFEITGKYTYQWRAHPANCGTYFYHCHVNTALHVQMGMFGGLVVYPAGTKASDEWKLPFPDARPEWRFNKEVVWPAYAADPRWHELNHAAGVCGEDVGLNRFDPEYFMLGRFSQDPNGEPIEGDAPTGSALVDDPVAGQRNRQPIAVKATLGDSVYIRMISATYIPIEVDFGELNSQVKVIELDGRALRDRIDITGRGEGTNVVSVPWSSTQRRLSPAQRYGLLFQPTKQGTFPVTVTFRDWITNAVRGVARTTITVE